MMRTLILDANLLVLLVVGLTSRSLITKHKRLKAYVEADFDLLQGFIGEASQIVVTPNAVTEASNLLRQIANPDRDRIAVVLRELVEKVQERYLESKQIVGRNEFVRLGLTDCGLLDVTATIETLLTSDLDLYLAAERRGIRTINFNHARVDAGLLP